MVLSYISTDSRYYTYKSVIVIVCAARACIYYNSLNSFQFSRSVNYLYIYLVSRLMLSRTLLQCSLNLNKMVPEVVFVLGAPGAGKGTQCSLISEEFGFVHLSAGDLLREERQRSGSEFGEMIEEKIRNGLIVPVEVTCSLLHKAMQKSGKTRFLIDGFPRNKDNLEGWERVMSDKAKLLFVLFFECSQDKCTERCLGRGAAGSGRSDDNMESLQKRFNTYLNDTMPIINHYDQLGLVRRTSAEHSPEAVFKSVKEVFSASGLERTPN